MSGRAANDLNVAAAPGPAVRESPLATARFACRSAAFAVITLGMWGLLDVETAAHRRKAHRGLTGAEPPAPGEDAALTAKWSLRYGRVLAGLFGMRLRPGGSHIARREAYPGRSPDGIGRLFVLNHRSGLDIVIALALLEGSIVSRGDLAGWPLVGPGARRVGTLFVDRDDIKSGALLLREMTQRLRAGRGVTVFPEGTAFPGDAVRPFRAGAFLAARRSGAQVVPVGIAYRHADTTYGDESFLAHMRRVAGRSTIEVAIEAGEPFSPGRRSTEQLAEHARAEVATLVERARARLAADD